MVTHTACRVAVFSIQKHEIVQAEIFQRLLMFPMNWNETYENHLV